MDFFKIIAKTAKSGKIEVFPSFRVGRSTDLMVRSKTFYAIWDEERGLWSKDEHDVQRLVDKELYEYAEGKRNTVVLDMQNFTSRTWVNYRDYMRNMFDTMIALDDRLTFANQKVTKKDYVSKRLPYSLEEGSHESWNTLMSTLYDPEELEKLEWAIGSIVAGKSKDIQKFIFIYGEPGGGKSTFLNILQSLFEGYYTVFESKALGSSSNAFAYEPFKGNPLVAIEHDGDLSRIEDNTKINSIVSHEMIPMNEKFKSSYPARSNAFLFIGSNKPSTITDAKSGLIRRMIDVHTSGRKVSLQDYNVLMNRVQFELGAIAHHCLEVFNSLKEGYYKDYMPRDMMGRTNPFYNFVQDNIYIFQTNDMTNLAQAWEMYKSWCSESNIEHRLPRHKFRDELRNYFKTFVERVRLEDGSQPRNVYQGFRLEKFETVVEEVHIDPISLVLGNDKSLLNDVLADCQAQYATELGLPTHRWTNVTTTLKDIDPHKLHYVVLPKNHIVIDFDLKDNSGEKSLLLNIEAASKWPPTYAEYSKSGKGIHLHYIYDEDPDKLSGLYSEDIEIKHTIVGDKGPTSLRRQFTKCNNTSIAHINSGLPLKGEKMIDTKAVASEKGLRDLIMRNLNKEIHPGTKPSIDFINKILDDAYSSGMKYDVTQLRPKVLAFANNSSNQAEYCVKQVSKMKFQSEEKEIETPTTEDDNTDENLVFYDVEVFSNLFIVCWKRQGKDQKTVRMINPTSSQIEELFSMKLIGFNNRRYDNHILYARYIGYNNEDLFKLSSKIVSNEAQNGYFREAYNISYTDIYDFSSAANKKSLKKWEIELGIHHQELGHPWDQPIPEDLWIQAAEYCENDVLATEIVFNHLSGDWAARKVLSELSGLSVNDTTNQHTTKIIFGNVKDTENDLVYTDLSTIFPGYTFDAGKSTYRGEEVGEGGYVYAEPGMYENVALLDVASMHPASMIALNLLGKYTKRFEDMRSARIAIKRNDRKSLETLLEGKLVPFLERADQGQFSLKDLSNGLKTALNSGYGLTFAGFYNPFKDKRNVDNIVAKRGALFMVDLKYAVQEKGYQVAHIKTDSIKIPNATPEIISFVFEFGKKYGYDFEHESTYSKFCLVNDAVYIAKNKDGHWTATGAQFAHPFVFKSLFSKEEIKFEDLCEAKAVTGKSALYLDMNEDLKEGEHNYQFVGRVGLFCPVEPGTGGGLLTREKEGKYYAATGSKGYRWLEAEAVKDLGLSDQIDTAYHDALVADAIEHISKFGDFDKFVSE